MCQGVQTQRWVHQNLQHWNPDMESRNKKLNEKLGAEHLASSTVVPQAKYWKTPKKGCPFLIHHRKWTPPATCLISTENGTVYNLVK